MGFQESGLRVSILGVAEFRRNAAAIRSDVDSFNRALFSSEGAGSSFANTLNRIGNSLSHIGRTMSLTVTAPILGLGTSLLNAGIQFEDAFADVSKTVDGVSDKFGTLTTKGTELRTEIRQMALDIPVTAKELALLGGQAGQLGVSIQAMPGFLRTIADLGVATNMSAETAGDAIARFANIMGIASKDLGDFASRAGSAIVDLGNKSAATESDIVALAMRISGAGRAIGLTAQEIIALSTSIAELGVNAESGGTAASRILLVMQTAAAEGGEQLELFAKAAGVTAEAFKALVKNSPAIAFTKVVSGLSNMQEAGTLTGETLTGLELNTIRLRDLVNRLGPNMENLTENINTANTAWSENTALTIEAEKKYKTIKNQLVLMKNAFNELGIVIFDLYRNQIAGSIKRFTDFVKKLSELENGTIKTIVKIALLVAAIGPLLIIVGTLAQLIATAVGGLSLLGTAMGFLVAPIMLVVGAVAALGVAWKLNLGDIQTRLPKIVDAFKYVAYWMGKAFNFGKNKPGGNTFSGIGAAIRSLTYIYKDHYTTFFSKILRPLGLADPVAKKFGLAIRNFLTPALLALARGFDIVSETFNVMRMWLGHGNWTQALVVAIQGILKLFGMGSIESAKVANDIKNAFYSIGSFLLERVLPVIAEFGEWYITKFVPGIVNIITTAVIPLFMEFAKTIGQLWKIVEPDLMSLYDWFTKKALPAIMNFITGTVIPGVKILILALKGIWELTSPYLVAFVTFIYAAFKYGVWAVISSLLIPIIESFIALLKSIWEKVKEPLGELYGWFVETAGPAIRDFILEDIYNALQNFQDNLSNLWNNTKSFLFALYDWFMVTGLPVVLDYIQNNIIGGLKDLRQNIIDLWNNDVKDALQGLLDWVEALPGKIEEQATNLINSGKKLANDLLNGILDTLKSAPATLANVIIDLLNNAINLIPDFSIDLGILGELNIGIPDSPIPKFSAGATGGMLSGKPLMTGERGPEMFVPGQSGMLLSNNITNMLMNQPAPTSINNNRSVVNNFAPNLNGITSMGTSEDIGYELMRLYHMSQAQVIA